MKPRDRSSRGHYLQCRGKSMGHDALMQAVHTHTQHTHTQLLTST